MTDSPTIREVTLRTGIPSSALRFYERRGLIAPSGRRAGKRVYGPDIYARLALIDMAKLAGFTVAEIAAVLDLSTGLPREHWQAVARPKLSELDERIAAAQRARDFLRHALECPEPDAARCPGFQAKLAAHTEALARG
ncbi:MerR family DNA-binding protein [Phytomonospora endophytica]|uniref:DNA-binding transcriptional MerR regulator n=1 Tax=Phytomonospora endophytica TaxID=714109 RepID=A0A841FPB7_9ACTN|nr:MerR family DNA-binding protein [Phytomonospora endophytica]MBB6035402.1 DNA-binding transcriptional MerR regulator [Phytomonospora endophytica]GIG63846.1 MerR family transcriptional regulator [Phytomonospora endophytica]